MITAVQIRNSGRPVLVVITREEAPTMNRTMSPLARMGHRVAAIVAEMNDAGNRLASPQHTPERF
jgi:hypothetical protein